MIPGTRRPLRKADGAGAGGGSKSLEWEGELTEITILSSANGNAILSKEVWGWIPTTHLNYFPGDLIEVIFPQNKLLGTFAHADSTAI